MGGAVALPRPIEPPPILETPRLRLRPPVIEDAEAMFATYTQDAEVTRYLTWRPHDDIERTREFLRRQAASSRQGTAVPWAIVGKTDDRLLGSIELRPDGHRANLGYVLGRPYWGHGLMTEAARAVVEWGLSRPGIHRVWAVCDVDNAASERVLEKVGMLREGLLRRWMMHPTISDTPRDCWCYARVR